MKAAVFSDTHGVTSLMLEAVRRCRPDVMIHRAIMSATRSACARSSRRYRCTASAATAT